MNNMHSTIEWGEYAASLDRLFEQWVKLDTEAKSHGYKCDRSNAAANRASCRYSEERSAAIEAREASARRCGRG